MVVSSRSETGALVSINIVTSEANPKRNEIVPDMPTWPLNCPENWLGERFAGNEDWIETMPSEVISNVGAALARAKGRGLRPTEFGKEDFPLPAFVAFARRLQKEMEEGRGFALVRGLPMERYSKDDAAVVSGGPPAISATSSRGTVTAT